MKVQVMIAAVACLLTACNSEMKEEVTNEVTAPVTVRLNGFTMNQGEIPTTRATAVGDYDGVKTLILAFYKTSDGTEVYKHAQVRNDNTTYTTFGEFTTNLPVDNYTLVVIGSGGNNTLTLTNATSASYGENYVQDTFLYTQQVNIANGSAVNLSATLDRVVTALALRSTDNRPADVTNMRFTFSAGGKSFNPSTGLATSNTGFVHAMDFTSAVGATSFSGSYLFLATDTQNMDVTIETLDADGNVVFSKTITNVPLKRNRQTTLTGAIYSGASVSANSFLINSTWISGETINF